MCGTHVAPRHRPHAHSFSRPWRSCAVVRQSGVLGCRSLRTFLDTRKQARKQASLCCFDPILGIPPSEDRTSPGAVLVPAEARLVTSLCGMEGMPWQNATPSPCVRHALRWRRTEQRRWNFGHAWDRKQTIVSCSGSTSCRRLRAGCHVGGLSRLCADREGLAAAA